MIIPFLILVELLVFGIISSGYGQVQAFIALGGLLMGTMLIGLF